MKRLLSAGAGLILLSLSLALETHNMPVLASERRIVGRMVKNEANEPERGQIRCERYIISGMPCERYEHETSEEEGIGVVEELQVAPSDSREAEPMPATEAVAYTAETSCEVQVLPAVSTEAEPQASEYTEHSNDGLLLPDYLRSLLESYGIGWWYPYAYAQVMQESHWNPNAVNANGLDFGLLQYRLKSPDGTRIYWTGPGDIMDPYAQIQKYVGQVKARTDAGLSVEEIISRHMTSDWVTDINWQYVQDVLRWMQ